MSEFDNRVTPASIANDPGRAQVDAIAALIAQFDKICFGFGPRWANRTVSAIKPASQEVESINTGCHFVFTSVSKGIWLKIENNGLM